MDRKAEDLIRELPKALIQWYDFPKRAKVLFVTGGEKVFDVLPEVLQEYEMHVEQVALAELEGQEQRNAHLEKQYQYIVLISALEYSKSPKEVLRKLFTMLQPGGRLLLGTDNRLGIRYFCGDRDRFTDRNFDGIENYAGIDPVSSRELKGRAYAKAELTGFLEAAGFMGRRFYSVFPALDRPQALYAENYTPTEQLDIRIAPQYYHPDTVFLSEEKLYTTLVQNGLLHTMANAYLIECMKEENAADFVEIDQVTISADRGRQDALATMIYNDGKVLKKALYPEGRERLEKLAANMEDLRSHGVAVVETKMENGCLTMPYVEGMGATQYFRELLVKDKILFLKELDRFWELIQRSSDHAAYEDVDWEHFDPEWKKRKADDPNRDRWRKAAFGTQEEQESLGVILKRGYIDLVSLNCIYADGEFVFFDQEFWVENLPAKAILMRTIHFIYAETADLETHLPKKELLERYHMERYVGLWDAFAAAFLNQLRKEEMLSVYYQHCRGNTGTIQTNRQKINYSVHNYERLFRDIFRGTEGKQIYLFGSGTFTKKFLSRFGKDYEIAGIFDNDLSKWGTKLSGISILSPTELISMEPTSYKVIICIKDYVMVIRQLQQLGVRDYAVYNGHLEYPRKMPALMSVKDDKPAKPKKYHVGYLSGVFDLFHIGHLNLLRRAKEQCDYLIVGVVNDESVVNNKKTMPYIPFEERLEIVRSCRYVDEAVEIPTVDASSDEAYRRYQFDVQFMGSDYADSPWWQAKREEFRKLGSDIVFFPYTESTSSTKIKVMIEKGLL
ncbi:MAG: adenylyltransferase/cytidyltransferase family protein [Lachnospiraceae bacterium]|nr:adenylyltransferase/cytidyltransferase family protein [Lachnospiraceae bacterium]